MRFGWRLGHAQGSEGFGAHSTGTLLLVQMIPFCMYMASIARRPSIQSQQTVQSICGTFPGLITASPPIVRVQAFVQPQVLSAVRIELSIRSMQGTISCRVEI